MSGNNKFKVPKSPAACADLLYKLREERLRLDRQSEELSKKEAALREYFIENLPKSEATGIAGKVARVQISTKVVPQVADWDEFYKYVQKNKAFFLLQRRLNEGAVKDVWEAKKELPGVTRFNAPVVSCTKLK